MKREYSESFKMYDMNNKQVLTLFDVRPLAETETTLTITNKSYSKLYVCLETVHQNSSGYACIKYILLNKLDINKNLDVITLLKNISQLEKKDFAIKNFKFYTENYNDFLVKLNAKKNRKNK